VLAEEGARIKRGIRGFITGGLREAVTYRYGDLQGVDLKPAGLTPGMLTFRQKDESQSKNLGVLMAFRDPNSVVFSWLDNELFVAAHDEIVSRILVY
jgi:hypothetical protein